MIRIDALLLATAPLDMRAGPDKALGRVVEVFGAARMHHAYLRIDHAWSREAIDPSDLESFDGHRPSSVFW